MADVNSPMMIMTSVRVHDETNPIIVPIVLFPDCNDVARVGKSPNLLGVAIAPTCPLSVAIMAFFSDIFSICDTAYFHFIDSVNMFSGISNMQIIR